MSEVYYKQGSSHVMFKQGNDWIPARIERVKELSVDKGVQIKDMKSLETVLSLGTVKHVEYLSFSGLCWCYGSGMEGYTPDQAFFDMFV